jgi:transcriptional regulator with PAS, ATPase and Fis domain
VPIEVPSLRERKVDIPLYINYFLGKINKQLQAKVTGISDETLKIMVDYRWPGNVRELINVLGQSILNVTEGHVILKEHLPHFLFAKSYHYTEMGSKLRNILEETESQVIKRTLISTKGNKKKAATLLGIQRSVLYQKLEKYQINFKTESF